MESIFSKEEN
jgi:hypothetical protein